MTYQKTQNRLLKNLREISKETGTTYVQTKCEGETCIAFQYPGYKDILVHESIVLYMDPQFCINVIENENSQDDRL